MSETIRLDKYLADMGCGTRSEVKQMIRKGQVEVNGEKAKKPELKITTGQDRVCVAGKKSAMKNTGICCFTNRRLRVGDHR